MEISVKRVYDPASDADGFRVLVDRLWPRGVPIDDAKIDRWMKELAPSNELRAWFHDDKEGRYHVFARRYQSELESLSADVFGDVRSHPKVTVVTAVKDVPHSHIPTLVAFLERE